MTVANAIGCRNERKIRKPSAKAPTSKTRRNTTLGIKFCFLTRKPGCRFGLAADRQCILSRLQGAIAAREELRRRLARTVEIGIGKHRGRSELNDRRLCPTPRAGMRRWVASFLVLPLKDYGFSSCNAAPSLERGGPPL